MMRIKKLLNTIRFTHKKENSITLLISGFVCGTIFEAIVNVTPEKPYIQCETQANLNIKLRPIDSISICEVYYLGRLINSDYKIKEYELKEIWTTVS